jgi:hypothetical protein
MLSALISLLTGCIGKPAPPPAKPGVSFPLSYPVLLVSDRSIDTRDNEPSLITTSVANGLYFPEYKLIDASGAQFSVRKVTQFGRKSVVFDMGTSHFQVFLELKREGDISLKKAKARVFAVAVQSVGIGANAKIAGPKIESAQSFPDLIRICGKTWEWR